MPLCCTSFGSTPRSKEFFPYSEFEINLDNIPLHERPNNPHFTDFRFSKRPCSAGLRPHKPQLAQFQFTQFISAGGISAVYAATLPDGGLTSYAVKLVVGKDKFKLLAHEAALYEHALKPLQGDVVPIFYGLFRNRQNSAACIVLEHCGEQLVDTLQHTPASAKRDIMQAFKRLHDAGLEYGEYLEAWNLLSHHGQPRFINFDRAALHDCPCKKLGIMEGARFDHVRQTLRCKEFTDMGAAIEFWPPSPIEVGEEIEVDVNY